MSVAVGALRAGIALVGMVVCGAVQAAPPVASATAAGAGSAPAGTPLLCERYGGVPEARGPRAGMVKLPAGRFTMGSDDHYPEEALSREVKVDGFWIDRHDVTNAQFARFVAATGHVSVAERTPTVAAKAGAAPAAGSAVFVFPKDGRPGAWRFIAGADWRHPQGPGSSIEGRANHPVVQIAYEDALAYARWLGRELPTEAQWEYASRGGLEAQPYAWGEAFTPDGRPMANTWQGPFPLVNTGDDRFMGTSPVGCFPANGYGLYDMAGNVWQWTRSWYRPGHSGQAETNPLGPHQRDAYDTRQPGVPVLVIKGGSHLCAPNYCARYRPAARQPQDPSFGTSHIGFRTVAAP